MWANIKNKLWKIDRWVSSGNRTNIVLLLFFVLAFMLKYNSTMIYGIGLYLFMILWFVFVKIKILEGKLKFDKSCYKLPTIGETIQVQKAFKYNISKVSKSRNYIYHNIYSTFHRGLEFNIIDIQELDNDWIVKLNCKSLFKPMIIKVFWLDVKDYFMTTKDVREEKLKKILGTKK